MASADGHSTDLLSERARPVLAAAPRASFFAIVALLERLTPDRARVGGDGPVTEEAIRFRHDPALAFSPGDIREASFRSIPVLGGQSEGATRPGVELVTTFLGLTGAISPLPSYIPEEVVHEDPQSPLRRDFLDIFHHRLVSLLYRAVSRYSPAREHRAEGADPWVERTLALAGVYPEGPFRAALPTAVLLRLAPLLAQRSRSERALRLALGCALEEWLAPAGATVRIEQLTGGYAPIEVDQQSQLGRSNHALGKSLFLGRRVYDRQGRFTVRIGPLDRDCYGEFRSGGEPLRRIRAVVSLVCREPLDYDLELELAAEAAERFRLEAPGRAALGTHTRLAGGSAAQVSIIRDLGNSP